MRNPFRKREENADLDKEIRFHIEERKQTLMAQGLPPEEAHRQARVEFGAIDSVKEECRDAESTWLWRWTDELFGDLRHGIRLMAKKPLFAASMVLTLGICIGAVTAVFSVVDTTLLRPLSYPEPERLAQVVIRSSFEGNTGLQSSQNGVTWEHFVKSVKTTDLTVYRESMENLNFNSTGEAGYIRQQRVGSGFFRVFGLSPLIGREFTPEEDLPNGPPVAVLNYNFWRSAFGSDQTIAGRSVTIAGVEYRIVGVASPQFQSNADVWTPLRPSPRGEGQGLNYSIVGRLRNGATWAQADTEMALAGQSLIEQRHFDRRIVARYGLISLQDAATESLASSLWIILAAAMLVLLTGCVNIAGMLMAQSVSRRAEIATRLAIGANRSTIIRQLLSESLIVAIAAGFVGLTIGYFSLEWLKQILPPAFSALQTARLDFRVIAAVGCLSILSSIVFGLLPAVQAGNVEIRTAQSSRGTLNPRGSFKRRALSTVQITIAVVILIGAGLLIRSFTYLSTLNPGLDGANVITANFALLDARYSNADIANRYFDEVLQRLQHIPGVEAAAVTHSLPYERGMNIVISKSGDAAATPARLTNWAYISPQFFKVFRIPVLRGRAFEDSDRAGSPAIALINDAFAKRYFSGEEAVGSPLRVFGQDRVIVGIVGDVLQQAGWGNFGPMGRVPTVYIPAAQPGPAGLRAPSPSWTVRTAGSSPAIQKQIEAAVKSVDPQLPVATFRSLNEINLHSLGLQRFVATLLAIAAALSLLLAVIGTFAMTSNSVAERSREFGIRLALGCAAGRAVGACTMSGMICSAIGLAAGLALSRLATRLLQGMLYGITPADPFTYIAVGAAVIVIAGLASLAPALRIARLDPAQILRHE